MFYKNNDLLKNKLSKHFLWIENISTSNFYQNELKNKNCFFINRSININRKQADMIDFKK